VTYRRSTHLAVEYLEDRSLLSGGAIIPNLIPIPQLDVSTVPASGDQNPYGVAYVPADFAHGGPLHPGDILVSNFNNSSNLQGTGTTIMRVTPAGKVSVFFQGPSGIGLTTALGILQRGFVLVGSVPSTDGTSATAQQGSLLIIDRHGRQVANLTDSSLLDGPWDLTLNDEGDQAQVFISDVLSGTVTRIDLAVPEDGKPTVESKTQIGSGYTHRGDPAAFELGPTGLAYDAERDLLYVASTADNSIFVIPNAKDTRTRGGTGRVVYKDSVHLHGPLGLLRAPNGDLITANGDAINPDPSQPSELVEFTPNGRFVAQMSIDPNPAAPFGIALQVSNGQVSFAAVNDNHNTLEVWMFDQSDNQNKDDAKVPKRFDASVVVQDPGTDIQAKGVRLPADLAGRNSPSPLALLATGEQNRLGTFQQLLMPLGFKFVPRQILDVAFLELNLDRLD
jgi:DNA-binding beta-propeller fold protein YncE